MCVCVEGLVERGGGGIVTKVLNTITITCSRKRLICTKFYLTTKET